MWISKREYNYLQNEIEFYRRKADEEKLRADRINDELLLRLGSAPVSQEAIESSKEERTKKEDDWNKRRKQMTEIFGEVASAIEGSEEENSDEKGEDFMDFQPYEEVAVPASAKKN